MGFLHSLFWNLQELPEVINFLSFKTPARNLYVYQLQFCSSAPKPLLLNNQLFL